MARLRVERGVILEDLAAEIGVSTQQACKYLSGANRVSAGRLHDVATALGVDESYFFEGLHQREQPSRVDKVAMSIGRSVRRIRDRRHLLALARIARLLGEE
jgi:transcriptional regulator with XRE-family HTH domain